MRSADSATNRREALIWTGPRRPGLEHRPPAGARRARICASTRDRIRFRAHLPSQSSAIAASQLGSGRSPPSRPHARSLQRHFARGSPGVLVRPQRCPSLPSSGHSGPHRAGSHLPPSCSQCRDAAVRQIAQARSDLLPRPLPTIPRHTRPRGTLVMAVALLRVQHPSLLASRRATPTSHFNIGRTSRKRTSTHPPDSRRSRYCVWPI